MKRAREKEWGAARSESRAQGIASQNWISLHGRLIPVESTSWATHGMPTVTPHSENNNLHSLGGRPSAGRDAVSPGSLLFHPVSSHRKQSRWEAAAADGGAAADTRLPLRQNARLTTVEEVMERVPPPQVLCILRGEFDRVYSRVLCFKGHKLCKMPFFMPANKFLLESTNTI